VINLAQKDVAHSLGKFLVTAMGVGMLLGIVLIMIGVYRGMVVDAEILIKEDDLLKGKFLMIKRGKKGDFLVIVD